MNSRAHPAVVARLALGAALLLRPRLVLAGRDTSRSVAVARVLGARQLLEAIATNVRPAPLLSSAGAAVDAVHAATALGFAAAGPRRYRRLALLSGFGAVAFALGGIHHANVLARRNGSTSAR